MEAKNAPHPSSPGPNEIPSGRGLQTTFALPSRWELSDITTKLSSVHFIGLRPNRDPNKDVAINRDSAIYRDTAMGTIVGNLRYASTRLYDGVRIRVRFLVLLAQVKLLCSFPPERPSIRYS